MKIYIVTHDAEQFEGQPVYLSLDEDKAKGYAKVHNDKLTDDYSHYNVTPYELDQPIEDL